MSKVIQPPVLMSRILMFVLATSVVVLCALVIALAKMMPLERPEVFFLSNQTLSVNTVIEPLEPNPMNEMALRDYEEGFIREYIIVRNTLSSTNATLTRQNWTNVIKPWSNNRVYGALTRTTLYSRYMSGDQMPDVSCYVNFTDQNKEQAVVRTGHTDNYDEYTVTFAWVCKNSGGQTTQKNYKIRLKIQSVLNERSLDALQKLEKLRDNPLGTRVIEYTVLGGNGDPLDSDMNSL